MNASFVAASAVLDHAAALRQRRVGRSGYGPALVGLSVLSLVVCLPGAAGATTHSTGPTRVYDGSFCVSVSSSVSDDTKPVGQATARVESRGDGSSHCDAGLPKARHHLTQRILLRFRTAPGQPESLCAASPWIYNDVRTSADAVFAEFAAEDYCGAGQYRAETVGYAWNAGQWNGGLGGPTEWLSFPSVAASS